MANLVKSPADSPCPECCACPQPVIESKSRAASGRKWGWTSYCDIPETTDANGYPLWFRKVTGADSVSSSADYFPLNCYVRKTCDITRNYLTEYSLAGVVTYGGSSSTRTTQINLIDEDFPEGRCGEFDITEDGGFLGAPGCGISNGCGYDVAPGDVTTTVGDATVTLSGTTSYTNPLEPRHHWTTTASRTINLEEPYTDTDLRAHVIGKLPAWGSTWYSVFPYSALIFSSDHRDLSVAESVYRFRVPPVYVGRGRCFKILAWVERFLPDGGGDPVDTVRPAWTWDGNLPDGYLKTNLSTWPTSPEFSMAVPSDPGEVVFGYYVDSDDPGSFVEGLPVSICVGCA